MTTSPTPPNPADFDNRADYLAASNAWDRAQQDAQLLAKLGATGARTTDCPHGYTAFDSCPVCD